MKTRIAARIFVAGRLLGEETLEVDADEIESKFPEIASHHAKLVGDRPFMVEIEFLDEPDPMTRYFRFGTDPSGMVKPIEVALGSALHSNHVVPLARSLALVNRLNAGNPHFTPYKIPEKSNGR